MKFKEGLVKARSHIVFLLGLVVAFGLVINLETWSSDALPPASLPAIKIQSSVEIPAPEPLSEQEMEWAKIAWKYFENNYQESTGLVNSVEGYNATTMWDTASYMMALIAAKKLEIIGVDAFNSRIATVLLTFERMALFENRLPNKSYNTATAEMVNYQNQRTEEGIGWSAIDIGRLLVPLNILVWNYPQHTEKIRTILQRWDFNALQKNGQIYGAAKEKNEPTAYLQEGRLGYEEYAAKSFTLLGKDVNVALSYENFLDFVDIYGIKIPYDSRKPEEFTAHNYVVSEPYILDGIEFGWDRISAEISRRVYTVQEKRFEETGTPTAVSEDHIDQAPYFVYNTVFTDGKTWNCITEDGQDASQFKSLSTKAVMGWHMLYRTPYTTTLVKAIEDLYDRDKGWFSGKYEVSGKVNASITCNTNAIILEAICYKKFGKYLKLD
jgi:hypothetical protein